jgi:hypothetical protein
MFQAIHQKFCDRKMMQVSADYACETGTIRANVSQISA